MASAESVQVVISYQMPYFERLPTFLDQLDSRSTVVEPRQFVIIDFLTSEPCSMRFDSLDVNMKEPQEQVTSTMHVDKLGSEIPAGSRSGLLHNRCWLKHLCQITISSMRGNVGSTQVCRAAALRLVHATLCIKITGVQRASSLLLRFFMHGYYDIHSSR